MSEEGGCGHSREPLAAATGIVGDHSKDLRATREARSGSVGALPRSRESFPWEQSLTPGLPSRASGSPGEARIGLSKENPSSLSDSLEKSRRPPGAAFPEGRVIPKSRCLRMESPSIAGASLLPGKPKLLPWDPVCPSPAAFPKAPFPGCSHRAIPAMIPTIPGMIPVIPAIPGMIPEIPGMIPVIPAIPGMIPGMIPVIKGAIPMIPAIPGMIPVIPGTIPEMIPEMPGTIPAIPEMIPEIPVTIPAIPEMIPVIPGMIPEIPGTIPMIPTIPGMIPTIPGMIPMIPAIPGTIPAVPEMIPMIPGTIPGMTQARELPRVGFVGSEPSGGAATSQLLEHPGAPGMPPLGAAWKRHRERETELRPRTDSGSL
ncbi:PREDICTED: splicing factor 3A subunit 2-like [Corvus brachyrhynchos]|uniref:splicing factor 3A subunit 2-like n=1 Tax=Corvus brachyrhynchos TaxID=85066 RepID=UPI0008165409|nr:PREDICTED: splicing factor 3A subunit 2-like [Corvus brachyrhynchos]